MKKWIVGCLLTLGLLEPVCAQRVEASMDSVRKKIGSEFLLTLRTQVAPNTRVQFPKGQQFGPLEVLESYPIDTVKKSDRWEFVKKYGLTQFDSGRYILPKLAVRIAKKDVYTQPITVEVMPVQVDTLKQKMYDIKTIEAAPSPNNGLGWWIVLGIVGALVVVFILYRILKNRKTTTPTATPEPLVKPIEKATQKLMALDAAQWVSKGDVKHFYSELTEIVRTYLEEEIEIPAMERTTSELIAILELVSQNKNLRLSPETIATLEQVLRQADLVKFAKVRPDIQAIESDKNRIASTIITINKAIPEIEEVTDELEAWNAQQRELARQKQEAKARKQKQLRIAMASVATVGILIGGSIAYFGIDTIKDAILGNPTKEMYEGEWITSAYGDPNVELETPKVLTRVDSEKWAKNTYAVVKEMRTFTQGSLQEPLFVLVGTNYYKQEKNPFYNQETTQIDYDKVLEGITKSWENQGARNILYKNDGTFEIAEGVKGIRAYGTMTVEDEDGEQHRRYYEILLFNQNGGLQQVAVSYREDDPFGKKILERIQGSIKLQLFNFNG